MHLKSFCPLALIAPAHAMLRFSCSQLVVDRIDPLVQPGVAPSAHLHQIVGGNSFNASMDPSLDLPAMSSCTSCLFTEDFSNYWTAVLYFQARNGTYKRVPTFANQFLEPANGGITVYYIPPYDNKTPVTAFRPGFRMLVGDSTRRFDANDTEAHQLSFRCWDKNFTGDSTGAPGTGTDTKYLPKKPCPGGIRANHFFPTCWDGKNLDSPDHKSHVTYAKGGFENNGACPDSHPIKIPQILYEVAWDTSLFNNKDEWPEDGSQPFVFSFGDASGYGTHADYLFGWKGDALQRAMDAFCGVNCLELKTQTTQSANRCTIKPTVIEPIDGWLSELPGMVSVTA